MKKAFMGIIILVCFTLVLSVLIVGIDNKAGLNKKITKKETKDDKNKNSQQEKGILDKYNIKDLDISVYISKENKVKKLNIEDYVVGVVGGEMPVNFELEALKAQAVAARTYGLAHTKTFGGAQNRKASEGEVTDTTAFQVYMSKENRINSWPKKYADEYWNKLNKAVKETEGEVLAYDNNLVMFPYYFSTSSGKTEASVDVFNRDVPYLKSVVSSGEEIAPKYKSEFKYTYDEFINIVGNSKLKASDLKKQIKILGRSEAGSVKNIKIGDKTITGPEFRKLFKLTSSNFSIKFDDKNIVINCNGYGHGVGMSQWGANCMAKEGKKYKDILKHYYNGVKIFKIKK